uniref:Uncharacterized protein n=1 Tax=Siphoviridae sp. ctnpt50 TaxID=2827941 RepID=A0A8S5SER5_9CAUD|nr:MAG TPA: hypothetical protein [Siphoviridae sp. ctnpt50]
METMNLTRNIQSVVPDKAILDAPTPKTGDEYWYITTNDSESCVIGYGKLANQINRIKSLITTRSAYGSQFEKIFVFENPFEKIYVYSTSRVFSDLEILVKTVRGTYRTISFAVSAVVKIQEKGVNIAGLFN